MKHRQSQVTGAPKDATACWRRRTGRKVIAVEDEIVGADRENQVDCPDCLKAMQMLRRMADGRGRAKGHYS